jgi:cation diffusion facilitator family transporter
MSPPQEARRTAALSLWITVLLVAGKFFVWGLTSSLAVLSQALDSVADVIALGLVYVAVRVAEKPADESHHYGHDKAENLAAYTQTLFLGLLAVAIAWQAIGRLSDNTSPVTAPWYSFALMTLSAVVDAYRVRSMQAAGRRAGSQALAAGALNLTIDLGTALVTIVTLILVGAGIQIADAVGALLVVVAACYGAIRLGSRAVDVLMDRAPQEPVATIQAAASRAPGVAETRRVRVRGGGRQLFADVTVSARRTTSLERAHEIAEGVEEEIARALPGTDVVVHVEPQLDSGLLDRAHAAASRVDGVSEVHDVTVRSLQENGATYLRVTLHAKADPRMTLLESHQLADSVEDAVTSELGPEVRVDSHIEPEETTGVGNDVTEKRMDLVHALRRIASNEPDILDCHDVTVTNSGSHLALTAHLSGRRDVPLERIHDASERIEKAMQVEHSEVTSVLLHLEPA